MHEHRRSVLVAIVALLGLLLPRSARAQTQGEPWLVMAYLAGDNNLSEEMVRALQALQAGDLQGLDMKVVAQFDPSGLGLPTQRYDFSTPKPTLKDYLVTDYLDKIKNDPDPVKALEENTGNPNALSGFIKWAYDRQPAGSTTKYGEGRKLLLILSGHGSGTTEDFLLKDDNALDALSIQELGFEGGEEAHREKDRRPGNGRVLHEHV